jgi:hypothetical protein
LLSYQRLTHQSSDDTIGTRDDQVVHQGASHSAQDNSGPPGLDLRRGTHRVEEQPEGVLLRAAPKGGQTRYEDVRGCLGPVDRVVSVEEMKEVVLEEARRRWLSETRDRN